MSVKYKETSLSVSVQVLGTLKGLLTVGMFFLGTRCTLSIILTKVKQRLKSLRRLRSRFRLPHQLAEQPFVAGL
jgi:hypothetical protein